MISAARAPAASARGNPPRRLLFACRDNTPVLSVLAVTFPFFALVLAGYIAARRRMLPFEAIGGLNSFVLFFALPCMLYRFGVGTPIGQLLDPTALGLWLVCALLLVAATVKFSMNARIRWNDASFGALVAAFPNTGFMGVPLLVALLGARAAGPAILTILIDLVITSSLCIALSRLDGADEHGAALAARKALKGVALNPMPWAILLGGLSSALAWKVSANSTAGSWNWVTAANGTWSVEGTPPNDSPTEKASSSTFKSQKRCWMTIVISSGKRSIRCFGMETAGMRVLNVM